MKIDMKLLAKFLELVRSAKSKPKHTIPSSSLRFTPIKSSRKLTDADPMLQKAYKLIQSYFTHTLVITQSYRSVEEQQKLYASGRTKQGKIVTYIDGLKKKGKHNYYPSKAIDVAVKVNGKITWDKRYYLPLVGLAKKVSEELGFKVTSGGTWKKLKDYPHLEIK